LQSDLLLIIDRTITVFVFAIFARSIASFFMDPRSTIFDFLVTVTEPILRPIRSVMPRMGMFDLSPMAAILLLQFAVRPIVHAALG